MDFNEEKFKQKKLKFKVFSVIEAIHVMTFLTYDYEGGDKFFLKERGGISLSEAKVDSPLVIEYSEDNKYEVAYYCEEEGVKFIRIKNLK